MSEPEFSSSDYDRDFEEGAAYEKDREEYEQRQAEDPYSWGEEETHEDTYRSA